MTAPLSTAQVVRGPARPRWLLAALVLVAAAGACLPGAAAVDRAAMVRLGASVVKIEVRRAQGGFGLGSGVVVAGDKVVTNCHVTRDALAISVVRGETRWPVEAQASDIEHDLCMLRVPGLRSLASVQLGEPDGLRVGEALMALGYTGGAGLQTSEGDVVALHPLDGARVVQSSNWFNSGASGGGLFDAQSRLVGILTFRLRGGQAHYFAAPVEWLRALLPDTSDYRAVRPLAPGGAAFWEKPLDAQPNFLKAAVLENQQRWEELEGLAFNWTRSNAADPTPWYLHGRALEGLHRLPESQRALEQSLVLEPALREAWFQLGLVCLQQGLLARAREAQVRLESLQPERALELKRAMERP